MPAVTQRIKNYLGGVSRQPDEKKLGGQVVEAINAYPDVALGLTKRPGLKHITNLGSGTAYDNAKWFYIHRDNDERYIGCITPPVAPATEGGVFVWNAVSGVSCTVTYGTGAQAYLTGARTNYDILSIQDTSIVTNKTKVVATQSGATSTLGLHATLALETAAYSALYEVSIKIGNTTYNASYTSPTNASNAANTTLGLTFEETLTGIKNAINAQNVPNLTIVQTDQTLELSNTAAMTVTAKGGANTAFLTGFVDQTNNVADLKEQGQHGRIVKVVNTIDEADAYYAEFVAFDGVSGYGYWEEALKPGASPGLDDATMPHELVNTATNSFEFRKISYTARLVGDDVTNTHPSFVGKTIEQAFLYANRLGFLSQDNVSISQSGEFFNFYHVSARTVIDSDPVDISCSSVRPAVLHGVISTANGLILFSRTQQFMLTSVDNILTPSTVQIRSISNYEMDSNIDPVDVGTNINFVSKTSSYSRVFSMVTRGQLEVPQVLDVSKIINEYIPSTVDSMVASPQNQYICLTSQASRRMYLYSFYNNGETNLLESWYSWEAPGTVQTVAPDQDRLYVVTKQGSQFTLTEAIITQSPDDAIIINSDGSRVNPSVDLYAAPSSVVYDAANERTKCYLPYSDVSTLSPILLIKGSTASGSFVESGFTISPERGTDGTGDFFIVPKKNLTNAGEGALNVASDVIVGFKYNFEVTLPDTFYRMDREGKMSDYTARLTVSRYKFSLGLSGVMSFKITSKGRTEWTNLEPVADANYYLANDIPLVEERIVTLPIHQSNLNFTLKLYNDSPFPVSVGSMSWEGHYSPRFYRRT